MKSCSNCLHARICKHTEELKKIISSLAIIKYNIESENPDLTRFTDIESKEASLIDEIKTALATNCIDYLKGV